MTRLHLLPNAPILTLFSLALSLSLTSARPHPTLQHHHLPSNTTSINPTEIYRRAPLRNLKRGLENPMQLLYLLVVVIPILFVAWLCFKCKWKKAQKKRRNRKATGIESTDPAKRSKSWKPKKLFKFGKGSKEPVKSGPALARTPAPAGAGPPVGMEMGMGYVLDIEKTIPGAISVPSDPAKALKKAKKAVPLRALIRTASWFTSSTRKL